MDNLEKFSRCTVGIGLHLHGKESNFSRVVINYHLWYRVTKFGEFLIFLSNFVTYGIDILAFDDIALII